jgi:hypothetical protein
MGVFSFGLILWIWTREKHILQVWKLSHPVTILCLCVCYLFVWFGLMNLPHFDISKLQLNWLIALWSMASLLLIISRQGMKEVGWHSKPSRWLWLKSKIYASIKLSMRFSVLAFASFLAFILKPEIVGIDLVLATF